MNKFILEAVFVLGNLFSQPGPPRALLIAPSCIPIDGGIGIFTIVLILDINATTNDSLINKLIHPFVSCSLFLLL